MIPVFIFNRWLLLVSKNVSKGQTISRFIFRTGFEFFSGGFCQDGPVSFHQLVMCGDGSLFCRLRIRCWQRNRWLPLREGRLGESWRNPSPRHPSLVKNFSFFSPFFFLLGTGRSVNEKPMSFRADEQEKVRARKKFFPSVPGLRFFPSGGPRHVEVRRR